MAIYHFGQVKVISRASGKSAIASSAYISAEKLYSEYDNITRNYSRKSGVIFKEVMLCDNAPLEWKDRQILWNAVEKIEKSKTSQLARTFDVGLQKEFSLKENIELIKNYVRENFINNGMCADVCIHDKGDGNPHAHIMLTMRKIDKNGMFLPKAEKKYKCRNLAEEEKFFSAKELKENIGFEKLYKCKYKSIYMELTKSQLKSNEFRNFKIVSKYPVDIKIDKCADWNNQKNVELWRKKWAEINNDKFKEKGLNIKLDERSYEKQGIEKIPTIHEGYQARKLVKDGKKSDRVEYNNKIKKVNEKIKNIDKNINDLNKGKAAIKEIELTKDQLNGKNKIEKSINELEGKEIAIKGIDKQIENINNKIKKLSSGAVASIKYREQIKQLKEQIKLLEYKKSILKNENKTINIDNLHKKLDVIKDKEKIMQKLEEQVNKAMRIVEKGMKQNMSENLQKGWTLPQNEKVDVLKTGLESRTLIDKPEIDQKAMKSKAMEVNANIQNLYESKNALLRQQKEISDKLNADTEKRDTIDNLNKIIKSKSESINNLGFLKKTDRQQKKAYKEQIDQLQSEVNLKQKQLLDNNAILDLQMNKDKLQNEINMIDKDIRNNTIQFNDYMSLTKQGIAQDMLHKDMYKKPEEFDYKTNNENIKSELYLLQDKQKELKLINEDIANGKKEVQGIKLEERKEEILSVYGNEKEINNKIQNLLDKKKDDAIENKGNNINKDHKRHTMQELNEISNQKLQFENIRKSTLASSDDSLKENLSKDEVKELKCLSAEEKRILNERAVEPKSKSKNKINYKYYERVR